MLWHKMKNVILALLLVTNMFLLALFLSQEVKWEEEEQEARSLAIEFLGQRGILVDEGMIPEKITLYPYEVLWNREKEGEYALDLLGPVEMESLGGDIVRYFNDNGELRFHDNGEFYANFSSGFYEGNLGEEKKVALEVLKGLGIDGYFLEEFSQFEENTLVFLQEFKENPLVGCEVRFVFREGELREISQGKRLEGEFLKKNEDNITVATALVQCYNGWVELGEDCREILQIESCYLVSTPLTASATMNPSWQITTDLGVYYLDTLTGKLEGSN